jgi:hypothetical protein
MGKLTKTQRLKRRFSRVSERFGRVQNYLDDYTAIALQTQFKVLSFDIAIQHDKPYALERRIDQLGHRLSLYTAVSTL